MDSSIVDLLECSICLEQLDDKNRVLPCQHTFCLKCLTYIVEAKGHLQCPECRSDFPQIQISSLPQNVILNRILEGLKSRRESSENDASSGNCNAQSSRNSAKRLSAKVKCEARLNQPCARGLYNFSSDEPGDLPFSKGDVIELVHEIDANWFEGILKGKRGAIPRNFVEILLPLPKIDDDSIDTPFAKACYSYQNKDEPELLSFHSGDIIGVLKRVDNNWLEGILGGQYGIFPLNFVKINKACERLINLSASSTSNSSSGSDEDTVADKSKIKKQKKKDNSPWVRRNERGDSKSCNCRRSHARNSNSPEGGDAESNINIRSSGEHIDAQNRNSNGSQSEDNIVASNSSSSSSPEENPQDAPKRHTIHVENPIEQRRQSRRALNLPDDINQPRPRLRTRSQGRRGSGTVPQDTAIYANAIIMNRLRNSNGQPDNPGRSISAPLRMPAPGAIFTTSVSNRSSEQLASGSPSNTPPNLGLGDIYIALFTYSPAQDDELALIQGDQYCVVEKHLDGWYRGFHIRSKQSGVFPGNYVKLKSQMTSQMLRSLHSNRANIGYGSNPSSPVGEGSFSFPSTRSDNQAVSPDDSPIRAGKTSLFKKFKKNKSKRQQTTPPVLPNTTSSQSTSTSSSTSSVRPMPTTTSLQSSPVSSPPSYYHSSMPGPQHHRPCPLVPCEPPPPYTPSPDTSSAPEVDEAPSTTPLIEHVSTDDGEKFRVIHPYPPSHESELPLRLNDIIYVTQKRLDGWFKGKSERTGDIGIFPSIFVEPYNL